MNIYTEVEVAVHQAKDGPEYLKQYLSNEPWDTDGFITLLLDEHSETFELDCQEWLSRFANVNTDFQRITQTCIGLLENSDFLNFYDNAISQRNDFQERLTLVAESTSFFNHAKQYTLNDETDPQHGSKAYINDLFAKLKKSGFVYHPRKHINIMMCLFVLKPELMEFSIEELFSIIFTRQVEIWKQYPFRTVMIRALERYIQSTDDKLSTLSGNSSSIDNTMRALVVQLTLGEDKDDSIFDRNLSIARLYRYASYKALGKSLPMFSRAFEFLLGETKFGISMYSLYRSKAVDLIASYLNSEMTNRQKDENFGQWQFVNNNVCLQISNDKILLLPSEVNSNTKNALPDGLLPWNNIEVRVNDRVDVSTLNSTDILPYKNMWRDIENLLFSEHAKLEPQKYVRQYLAEGDETMITIDRAVDSENNYFHCAILDENIKGEAYIELSDIVSYLNHVFARYFYDSYGYKLKFKAKVLSVDDDGTYHMSMKRGIDEFIKSSVYEGMRFSCSVGDSYLPEFGVQRGISFEGFPMTVRLTDKLERNTRLTTEYVGFDEDYHAMKLEFVDLEPAQKYFTPSEAFQRLMTGYSLYCTAIEAERKKALEVKENATIPTMTRSHVYELMLLVDRIAILQQDYLTSYNYLAIARILARLLGQEDKRSYYNGRMDLIELLNYFAINNAVDEDKLNELENVNGDMFTQNIILRMRFNQVRLVSWLGKPEHNIDLREKWEDPGEDEIISDIAGLALSYNILTQAGLGNQASDVHNQIKNLLNLKGHESSLKNYGAMEDVTCEFKTSIVYVAGSSNKFDPETQMDNILKVVDEMLNTRGGIIYLGVNRYGQGVGLKNDLDNMLFHNDKEEYIRFIYKYISNKISPHAANVLVHIDFDKENTKHDVCIIKVDQSPMGFPFKGEYCVRRGDSVYRYDKAGYEEYRKIRDSIYASEEELKQTLLDEGLQAVSVKGTTVVESIEEKVSTWDTVQASTFIERIATSMQRQNRVVDMPPLRYLNFMGKGVYQFSDSPLGNIPLALPLYADDEYVVVIYTDGTAMYTPVSNLLDMEMNVEYEGVTNQRITYASTAGKDDSLLLVVNTRSGGIMRVQDFDRIQKGELLCVGKEVITTETTTVEYIEIVGEDVKSQFKKCRNMDCDLDSKHGKKNMEKLVELGVG